MRRTMSHWTVLLAAGLIVGCGSEPAEDVVPDTREARSDSVAMAEAMYDAAVFDTITWESDQAVWDRGGVVWMHSCQMCHGTAGAGDGAEAARVDITVPDMRVEGWSYAGDLPAIRHKIYVGHETEMPSWGAMGISYRDVDAAARYIDDLIHPTD